MNSKIRSYLAGGYHIYLRLKNKIFSKVFNGPEVVSIEDTIQYIIENKSSVSRFGDGEFKWMADIPQPSFQKQSVQLSERLIEVIFSDEPNLLITIPDAFRDLNHYNLYAKKYWEVTMGKYRLKWLKYLKKNTVYYNTNITRFYMDFIDKSRCDHIISLLKKIWDKRDILIVEGDKTRLGVNNDLFHNACSIERILCPSQNAFEKYDAIITEINKVDLKNKLVLIALGPTATILAYDLGKCGVQAIDVGHVDIEYEWYLQGATQKIPIKNKFTNEATHLGGREVQDNTDLAYKSQIISII